MSVTVVHQRGGDKHIDDIPIGIWFLATTNKCGSTRQLYVKIRDRTFMAVADRCSIQDGYSWFYQYELATSVNIEAHIP